LQLLNIQLRCSGRSPILDCRIGKSLRGGWNVRENRRRLNASAAVGILMILNRERAFNGISRAVTSKRKGFLCEAAFEHIK